MSWKSTRKPIRSYAGTIFRPGEPVPGEFERTSQPVEVCDVFYERKQRPDRSEIVDGNIQVVEKERYELSMNWIPHKINTDHWLVDDMGEKFNFVKVDDTDPRRLLIEAIMEPYTGKIQISGYPYVRRRAIVLQVFAVVADEFGVAVADEFGNAVVGEMP